MPEQYTAMLESYIIESDPAMEGIEQIKTWAKEKTEWVGRKIKELIHKIQVFFDKLVNSVGIYVHTKGYGIWKSLYNKTARKLGEEPVADTWQAGVTEIKKAVAMNNAKEAYTKMSKGDINSVKALMIKSAENAEDRVTSKLRAIASAGKDAGELNALLPDILRVHNMMLEGYRLILMKSKSEALKVEYKNPKAPDAAE